jgi:hypothetical protein
MAISSISPATCTSTPAAARIIRAQPTRAILLAKATAAMSVLNSKRAKQDPWLVKLLANKERKVAPRGLPDHFGGGLNGCRREAREACEGKDA